MKALLRRKTSDFFADRPIVGQRSLLCAVASSCLFFCSVAAAAQLVPEGTAKGAFLLNNTKVPVTYVYAIENLPIPETRSSIEPERSIVLLVSDKRLQSTDREMRVRPAAWLHRSQPEAERHVVDIEITLSVKEEGTGWSGKLRRVRIAWQDGTSTTSFGSGVNAYLNGLDIKDGVVHGEIATRDLTPIDPNDSSRQDTYGFNIAFEAPFLRSPQVTEILTGDAASKSEQVQAVVRFYDAMRRADVKAIRGLVQPNGVVLRQIEGPKGDVMLQWMRAEIPFAPEAVPANVAKVVVFDDLAMVMMNGRNWEALIKKNGVWTIDDR